MFSPQDAVVTKSASSANVPSTSTPSPKEYRLPDIKTLEHAFRLSVNEDRPIMMDYWLTSIGAGSPDEKKPVIGVKPDKEKMLVKNEEEYTSPISRIFKTGNEFIIMTENSIYIVDASIKPSAIA